MDKHNHPEDDGRAAEHEKGNGLPDISVAAPYRKSNGAERISRSSLAGQKSAVGQKEVDMKRRA